MKQIVDGSAANINVIVFSLEKQFIDFINF